MNDFLRSDEDGLNLARAAKVSEVVEAALQPRSVLDEMEPRRTTPHLINEALIQNGATSGEDIAGLDTNTHNSMILLLAGITPGNSNLDF